MAASARHRGTCFLPSSPNNLSRILFLLLAVVPAAAVAHNISESNASYVAGLSGTAIIPFIYLGAKHMVTGFDHLLYLVAILFFVSKTRDVALYVTLFAAGHSMTLIAGVLADLAVNPYLVDAVIGLSIVYKAIENIGGWRTLFGWSPDPRAAVFFFGLCHGLGLATKLQQIALSSDGLLTNLISFNVGVELGQLFALMLVLALLIPMRWQARSDGTTIVVNNVLMACGFVFAGLQLTGLLLSAP